MLQIGPRGITTRVGGPIDPRSDEQLIADQDFDAIYWRHRDWVVSLAFRFTQNQDDALDVLQETFAYLARKFPNLKLTASMKTFLYPAVRNLSLEIRRKRRKAVQDDAAMDVIPAPAIPSDDRADLTAAMGNLPDNHREVLLLRFVDGLKIEEISEVLQIPMGTVKSRLHNALEQLRSDPKIRRYFE